MGLLPGLFHWLGNILKRRRLVHESFIISKSLTVSFINRYNRISGVGWLRILIAISQLTVNFLMTKLVKSKSARQVPDVTVSSGGPELAEGKGGAGVGVLEKAMYLLNIISAAPTSLTFTQLLHSCNLPKATLHRILSTLQREGLLRQDTYTKTFKLGFRLLELAHEVWSDFDLRIAAQDELIRLRDLVGESVCLVVMEGGHIVVVASEEAGAEMRVFTSVGMRLPVHASAAGKAMLAYLDPAQQMSVMDLIAFHPITPKTITSIPDLRSELNLTRARGYAIANQEHAPNVVSVAAPIFDFEGRPIGAIAVSGNGNQFDPARAHNLSSAVIGAARRITHNAGGTPMSIAANFPPENTNDADVRCVSQHRALLGEGPMWSPRDAALYWVDILAPSVHRFDIATGADVEIRLGAMVSVAVPKATGGLLVATPAGLMSLDTDTQRLTHFVHPESDRPGNRYNDGKCDRLGRLWVGSMDMGVAANRGNLFRVNPDGRYKKMDTGFTVCNGMGWSPDNSKMYLIDSFRKTIYQYEFDLLSGTIENRRPLVELDACAGSPDGLTVDDQGCLWVAMWDDWAIVRFSPEGKEMRRIRMPVPRPTSCCFGGNNLDTLYVTSASVRLTEETLASAPLSGSLFAIEIPGVRGLPETSFAG
jgi:sugar lactone lactonase YvrE/DNA-binding IclR family transcriptional regulator